MVDKQNGKKVMKTDLKVEEIEIGKIKPYENNPRHNEAAVDGVMESIKQFGFKVPMVIDKNNVIVTGHTRYKAAKKLGMKKIPCVRADDLNENQIKAFRIADNKVAEVATWDMELLQKELEEIEIDMSGFDIDISFDENKNDDIGYYGDERERTVSGYNLDTLDTSILTADFWQMPTIKNDGFIPDRLIGFNYAKTSKEKQTGIHFYLDDYQFERIWNNPEKYTDILFEYDCILSPDFSLYLNMPMPMKIWNVYRSRHIGAYYQSKGIRVIPTVSWAEPATFEFCFLGIPKNSIVSVSTIGVKEDEAKLNIWKDGMEEMLDRIDPAAILLYGEKIDFDFGDIKTVCFENDVVKNLRGIEKQ